MKRIVFVPFDQLNRNFGALRNADPQNDEVLIVESRRMLFGRNWHKQRLHFMLSSARHFARELQADGFSVTYLKSASSVEGIEEFKKIHPEASVVCATPNSYKMRTNLEAIGVEFLTNDFFLTSEALFKTWADKQKTFTMENFYRAQRTRLNILMHAGGPIGGQWNFDKENRLPPPHDHNWGDPLYFELDEIDSEVLNELPADTWGEFEHKTWGTNRQEAVAQMQHFFDNHFKDFGPYEDAIPSRSWSAHHSLLSPYLNIGLLHPAEVVEAALKRFALGDIPLSSCEGFIRQIIGWREYINGMYWYLGEDYRDMNGLGVHQSLLPLFNDPSQTKMNCVGSVVRDVSSFGWTHHIPRLMILSNLALLTGVEPKQFLAWMREVFVDAADWVMVPNIIGMATHADNGTLMTKPYAAGGAYISKMSEHCKSCIYDPKKRTGEDACPLTTLYWDFLNRNLEIFQNNHRMFQQIGGLKRLRDLPQTLARAEEVKVGLANGTI